MSAMASNNETINSNEISIKSEPLEPPECAVATKDDQLLAATNATINVKSEKTKTNECDISSDSFVIYELKEPETALVTPPVKVATVATTTRVLAVAPPTITVATTPTTPKPTIINTKFRKKRTIVNAETTPPPPPKLSKSSHEPTSPVINLTLDSSTSSSISEILKKSKEREIELKKICLCGLRNPDHQSDDAELRQFYEEMFNETRHLSRAQQRQVKMKLLEALSEAEEHAETGRNCDNCCS